MAGLKSTSLNSSGSRRCSSASGRTTSALRKTADLVALADLLGCRCDDLLPGRYRVTVEAADIEPSRRARIEAHFARHVETLQQLGVEFDRIVIERTGEIA